jgi:carboxynorspermidine decarboxylase
MLDPHAVPSPCFVLEERALQRNLEVLERVQADSGASIILALKGFAMFSVFPQLRRVLAGTTASSLFEARLGYEEFGPNVHAYAPAYIERDWDELARYCKHITFNSLAQFERYHKRGNGNSFGLRINPEYSPVKTDLYNPCVRGSRFGVRAAQVSSGLPPDVQGLHCHNLCESDSAAVARTLEQIERLFGHLLPAVKWLNLGGGHLMTRRGYDVDHLIAQLTAFRARHPHVDIILEPGSAVAWQTGVLVATVQDVVEADGIRTAILDASFATHMPDCLEMPYRPEIRGASMPADGKPTYRMGGCSCLAGDMVGDYSFEKPLHIGQRLVFEDMMHYTMVKTNMFNGVNLPTIGIWHENDTFEEVRSFTYQDYRNRLS